MTTINLDLTPEEEKKAKKIFAKDGQTLEDAILSFVYLSIENGESLEFHKMAKPKNKIKLESNGKGGLIVPKDAPEDFNKWVRNG